MNDFGGSWRRASGFGGSQVSVINITAASYTGPGDIVSGAFAWWGLRAYSAAAIGSNCVKLRRDSDNTTQDFVTIAGGGLDSAAITTFKGAANLRIDTLYDQTGNGRHLVQASTGSQPTFTLSGLGSLPIMGDNGGGNSLLTGSAQSLSQAFSVLAVARFTGTAGRYAYFGDSAGLVYIGQRGTTAILYAGAEVGVAVSTGWHSVLSLANGASSDICVDGTSNSANVGTSNISSSLLNVMQDAPGTANWFSDMTEVGVWASDITANKAALNTNTHTYWGI